MGESGRGLEAQGKDRKCVSLFVENIPERMQWKGLWHLFARHGEVVATFIARKLSRGGKRFGFVRFKDEVDAGRAMERLNGFEVYGYRMIVKPTNQKRNKADSNQRYRSFDSSAEDRRKGLLWNGSAEDRRKGSMRNGLGQKVPSVGKLKRKISGHVEEEDLWMLRRCLVGEMDTICSVGLITSRLEKWGLNGIKEIFCRVEEWSEKSKRPFRATWIEVAGLPLHCWNEVSMLISTDFAGRIEESVEIEVGNVVHEVSIVEMGFKDTSIDKVSWGNKLEQQTGKVESKSEGSSESSSEQVCCF
ncbi:hypothetical protein V6N13_055492 [Hibiscus sabdariffa]